MPDNPYNTDLQHYRFEHGNRFEFMEFWRFDRVAGTMPIIVMITRPFTRWFSYVVYPQEG